MIAFMTSEQVGVVRTEGDLSGSMDDGVHAAAMRLLADGASALVVNLAKSAFINSPGFGLLILLARRAEERGAAMRLASPSRHVRKVLPIIPKGVFEIYDTEEDAIRGREAADT